MTGAMATEWLAPDTPERLQMSVACSAIAAARAMPSLEFRGARRPPFQAGPRTLVNDNSKDARPSFPCYWAISRQLIRLPCGIGSATGTGGL
jgi:hypothetical protein